MLRRHATFFYVLRPAIDILVISGIWVVVYFVRFKWGLFSSPKGIPNFGRHLILGLPIVCICYLSCLWAGLYKPKRIQSMFTQLADILKASIFSGLLVLALLYYIQSHPYSRKLLILFIFALFGGLVLSHLFTMAIMRNLRRKGYNVRYYAVIGAGKKGQQLVQEIERIAWFGLRCRFFVDNSPSRIGTKLFGVPIYGPIEKLSELVSVKEIDEVYLALSGPEAQAAYPFLERLQCKGITVRIVPDWGNLTSTSKATAVTIGSQILFSAAESPLSGANIILKEAFDRATSLVLLVISAVPIGVIALLVKLTSKGPVFYRQARIGMDRREFAIIKFRTMPVDAEKENGPQWAKTNDPRCTRLGAWLRRTNLDELPQLMNVIKGEMSLVGPRPERPCFVEQFAEEYKKYMLRHKVKAGMTGWAQVHGFRGDTSLKKRLQYDLHYIRNWSLGLDLRILLLMTWQILTGKTAY